MESVLVARNPSPGDGVRARGTSPCLGHGFRGRGTDSASGERSPRPGRGIHARGTESVPRARNVLMNDSSSRISCPGHESRANYWECVPGARSPCPEHGVRAQGMESVRGERNPCFVLAYALRITFWQKVPSMRMERCAHDEDGGLLCFFATHSMSQVARRPIP